MTSLSSASIGFLDLAQRGSARWLPAVTGEGKSGHSQIAGSTASASTALMASGTALRPADRGCVDTAAAETVRARSSAAGPRALATLRPVTQLQVGHNWCMPHLQLIHLEPCAPPRPNVRTT